MNTRALEGPPFARILQWWWLLAALLTACSGAPPAAPHDGGGGASDVTLDAAQAPGPTGACTTVFDPLNEDRTLLRCDGLYVIQSSDAPAEPRQLRSVPRDRLVALISPKDFGRADAPFQMFLPDTEGTHAIDDAAPPRRPSPS